MSETSTFRRGHDAIWHVHSRSGNKRATKGLDAVAEAFKPHMSHGLVREALGILSKKYESVDSVGPVFVTNFDEQNDPDDRALRQRGAYERVQYLLAKLRGAG